MGLLLLGTCGIPGPVNGLGQRISSEDWLGVGKTLELQRSCPAGGLKSR